MARRCAKDVDADDDALLFYLATHSAGRPPVICVSIAVLCAALNRSDSQVRRSLRALQARGWTAVEHRFLPNGGQTESAYSVTPAGRAHLAGLG